MTEQRWNGDEWRWRIGWHPRPTNVTIAVIDAPEREEPANAHRVPFGFGVREPAPEAPRVEPLLWEGDGA